MSVDVSHEELSDEELSHKDELVQKLLEPVDVGRMDEDRVLPNQWVLEVSPELVPPVESGLEPEEPGLVFGPDPLRLDSLDRPFEVSLEVPTWLLAPPVEESVEAREEEVRLAEVNPALELSLESRLSLDAVASAEEELPEVVFDERLVRFHEELSP